MNIYLQGLTMGLAYVAPIGLQNLFVINSRPDPKAQPGVYHRPHRYFVGCVPGRCVLFWARER